MQFVTIPIEQFIMDYQMVIKLDENFKYYQSIRKRIFLYTPFFI
jgi:hypothetical protein